MLKLTENVLFVTSCVTTYVKSINHSKIISNIEDIQRTSSGNKLSNEGGWQSLVIQSPAFDNQETSNLFLNYIIPSAREVAKLWSLPLRDSNVGYWYNVNYKYSSNREHTHPNAFLSGVYYLKVPNDCGNITFLRAESEYDKMEFIHTRLTQQELVVDNTRINAEHWIQPEEGLLILFPGYLKHYVRQNLTNDLDDRRISLSFNFW